MKLGSVLFLGLVVLPACDAPGFKSKAKGPADVARAAPAVGQTETTSAGLTPLAGGASLIGPDGQKPAVFSQGLSVSDAIAKACGIHARGDRKQMEASFEYDSAALLEDDRALLAEVAKCLTDGALRGKRVTLIGRTDARGEPEYNMTLGDSRANAVHRYMVDLGVGKDTMTTTSRGELDATGQDEEGYRQDRRVDLELVN